MSLEKANGVQEQVTHISGACNNKPLRFQSTAKKVCIHTLYTVSAHVVALQVH